MKALHGKWALITGASSGFGREFAYLLAEQKVNLVLAARRTEAMQELAESLSRSHGVSVVVESIDLSQWEAAAELKSRLDARGIEVAFLLNNAGSGLYGDFVDQPLPKTMEMLQLNMLAVTELTHVFAQEMVRRHSGHILLMASLLGYQATPGYAAYAASKAYVLSFGEALHQELKPHGVGVTVLSPGPAATSFGDVAGQRNTPIVRLLMMKPRPVAAIGVRALLAGRSSVVPGVLNKFVVFSNRIAPRWLQRSIMGRALSGGGPVV
jgi:short-subunit dehydrogenase